jgi:LuxR family maltose regulon positive regulatory protein
MPRVVSGRRALARPAGKAVISAPGLPSARAPVVVLTPKLRAPVPRPEQLVRRGLIEQLHDALGRKVSVVSAPTGYGKTTLLAHWRRAEEEECLRFAWVSIDEQDNDPMRLWRHIVEALRGVLKEEEGFGADVLTSMSAVGRRFAETALPLLINELAGLPDRVVLVLDDYQFITENEAHGTVAFFVEHLSENVHLVVCGRSDPPLRLGRLRAMGEINELRAGDLAFSEEETGRLLNERMGLGIGPGDLSVLFERTEGWPAGVYLASLSLRDKEDKHAFIESFGGSNRYVVGLLGEEVLSGLDEEVRRFLLETSILRAMTDPLCDAVTGRKGSANLLRELARSNLFVVSLDEQGEWYRYHHLLSELLLYELKSTEPGLEALLRGRASEWLEGAGYFDSAIRQAVAAGDHERVGLLIARHWYGYAFSGQTATVQRWLASLPGEAIDRDAALCLVEAWLYALAGRREESARFLAQAEGIPHEGPLPDGTASVEAGAAVLRATFAFDGLCSALEDARRAAGLEPAGRSPWAALVRFALGTGLLLSGEVSRARKPLEEALELTAVADQPLSAIAVQCWLSMVAADEGHPEEAESRARAASALVDRFRLHGVPQATLAPIALGRALADLGRVEEARGQLEGALDARRRLPGLSPWPTLVGLLALARVRGALGDRAGGREALAEARTIVDAYPDAGVFPELLESQERTLRARKPREGQLDEELTERELEVLRLLPGELTTRQMAQSLYVTPNTVRTQIKSIYRKIGASSRRGAVEEARARGLF